MVQVYLGYRCECGKYEIEEGKNYLYTDKCFNLNCREKEQFHSRECKDKNYPLKKAEFTKIVDKHVNSCNKALHCIGCSKPFGFRDYTKVTSGLDVGNWHETCLTERERESKTSRKESVLIVKKRIELVRKVNRVSTVDVMTNF